MATEINDVLHALDQLQSKIDELDDGTGLEKGELALYEFLTMHNQVLLENVESNLTRLKEYID